MPTGTPLSLRCPKCRRGQFGHPRAVAGCAPTGRVENRLTRSNHKGHGNGGASFYGYRGEVECFDCGHTWFSSVPGSGRREKRYGESTVEVEIRVTPELRRVVAFRYGKKSATDEDVRTFADGVLDAAFGDLRAEFDDWEKTTGAKRVETPWEADACRELAKQYEREEKRTAIVRAEYAKSADRLVEHVASRMRGVGRRKK